MFISRFLPGVVDLLPVVSAQHEERAHARPDQVVGRVEGVLNSEFLDREHVADVPDRPDHPGMPLFLIALLEEVAPGGQHADEVGDQRSAEAEHGRVQTLPESEAAQRSDQARLVERVIATFSVLEGEEEGDDRPDGEGNRNRQVVASPGRVVRPEDHKAHDRPDSPACAAGLARTLHHRSDVGHEPEEGDDASNQAHQFVKVRL